MNTYKMKAPNCALFSIMRIVLYFLLKDIVLEIVLCIHYNKPVKVLLMLVHYGEIFYTVVFSIQM